MVYAYNTQVRKSTDTNLFELTVTWAVVPYMFDVQDFEAPQHITGEITPAQAKRYSRKQIDSIFKAAQTSFDKAQTFLKAEFDSIICFILQVAPR